MKQRRERSRTPERRLSDRVPSYEAFKEENWAGNEVKTAAAFMREKEHVCSSESETRRVFEQHMEEEWFIEKYHPVELAKRAQYHRKVAVEQVEHFKSLMGRIEHALNDRRHVEESTTEFFQHCIRVIRVEPHVSSSHIHERLSTLEGFQWFRFGLPSSMRGNIRCMVVKFADHDTCNEAFKQLKTGDWSSFGDIMAFPSTRENRVRVVPGLFSGQSRLESDLRTARAAARQLDEAAQVSFDLSSGLASLDAIEDQIGYVILYLRDVHCFCFYCARQFADEKELEAFCFQWHIREPASIDPPSESDLLTLERFETNISRLFKKPPTYALPDKVERMLMADFMDASIQQDGDKYVCIRGSSSFDTRADAEAYIASEFKEECAEHRRVSANYHFYRAFTLESPGRRRSIRNPKILFRQRHSYRDFDRIEPPKVEPKIDYGF